MPLRRSAGRSGCPARAGRRPATCAKSVRSRSTRLSATLSWTISRRSVVQRCPAVPAAENRIARLASSRSALGATIVALFPPSSSSTRPKRCATRGPTTRPIAVDPVAETNAIRGSSTNASPTSRPPWTSCTSPSGASPKRFQARPASAITASAQSGVFSLGFQIDRVAADQGQRRIPRPHRDGEVEGADYQHRPQRVPLLHHPMVWPLAGDGQAVELPRQADGEVADVDHLLDLAEALLEDLAAFERHEQCERPFAARSSSPSSRTSSPRRGAGTVRHSAKARAARSAACPHCRRSPDQSRRRRSASG